MSALSPGPSFRSRSGRSAELKIRRLHRLRRFRLCGVMRHTAKSTRSLRKSRGLAHWQFATENPNLRNLRIFQFALPAGLKELTPYFTRDAFVSVQSADISC